MPFTPYHLGPALLVGAPLRKKIHLPTFIAANVIVDVEPLLVLLLQPAGYPLHGYAHTILGALAIGILLSYAPLLYRRKFLKVDAGGARIYIVAGCSGTVMHVLLDSPLYYDIAPFYPLRYNPLYYPQLTQFMYDLCLYSFIAGLIAYIVSRILDRGTGGWAPQPS